MIEISPETPFDMLGHIKLVLADARARILDAVQSNFLRSSAMITVMIIAMFVALRTGVDLMQSGASVLLVVSWFLLAPLLSLIVILSGHQWVLVARAVIHCDQPTFKQFASCDPRALRRPPRL